MRRILVALYLIGLYTNLGLSIGGAYVSLLAPLAGLALLTLHIQERGSYQGRRRSD